MLEPIEQYQILLESHTIRLNSLSKKYNIISSLRLFTILLLAFTIYFWATTNNVFYCIPAIFLFVSFLSMMYYHQHLTTEKLREKALYTINKLELNYLKHKSTPFEDGVEFINHVHPCSHDLDLFGQGSLFQNINRTQTYLGKQTLGILLQSNLPQHTILNNQTAIEELTQKLKWRQYFEAIASIQKDSKKMVELLIAWSKEGNKLITKFKLFLSITIPILFLISIVLYGITDLQRFSSLALLFYLGNLTFLATQFKMISKEIAFSDNIHKTIAQYSLLIQIIENETFKSEELKRLQTQFNLQKKTASKAIKKLSNLLQQMDSMGNLFASLLFNGTFLYHFHTFRILIEWKQEYAPAIENWLKTIGEMEALLSLANMSFNNTAFVYPTLNNGHTIQFENIGHPLIDEGRRICNSVEFIETKFILLTGSNMSGKSTFLRSLGINMVLAGIGAPICASKANLHPLPLFVSMRLSDSLSENESYFFAEVKRLKQIMDSLDDQPHFVLLDEILRGTNSEDKRTGTVEVIKKMISKNVLGVIATHDIEVCNTTQLYPNYLTNACFEAQIINDELFFDYKLRPGVCKNKSATFLMQKMGII